MNNYRMIIQYDGSRYSGWQKQGNTQNTIQGKIEQVLLKMTGSPIEIHGSGRTDAGVHAQKQVANFKVDINKTPEEIKNYLNEYLPLDIRVFSVEAAAPRFHARLNAVQKHYRYIVNTNTVCDVFLRKYCYHSPKQYNLSDMKKAASYLTGEWDFKSFCDNRRMKKSTVRKIDSIIITECDGIITLDYLGNGFLYHMVRILTGTLLEVGEGKKSPEEIPGILQACQRDAAGYLAPPQGLLLVEVKY